MLKYIKILVRMRQVIYGYYFNFEKKKKIVENFYLNLSEDYKKFDMFIKTLNYFYKEWFFCYIMFRYPFYKDIVIVNGEYKGSFADWLEEAKRKDDIKWKIFINVWCFLKEINIELIIKMLLCLLLLKVFGYYNIELIKRSLYILLFIFTYRMLLRYPHKKGTVRLIKLKEKFKNYSFLNKIGLFIYKWSHVYFWWLEIKIMIINIMRVIRYIAIKLKIVNYIMKIDRVLLLLFIIIEKIFNIIIKIWNNIKIRIYEWNFEKLIFWRIRILLFLIIIFYIFRIEYILIFIIIVLFIFLLDVVIDELDIYFVKDLNLYEGFDYKVTSRSSGFVRSTSFELDNLYYINIYRFYLKYLYFEDIYALIDIYKVQMYIDFNSFNSGYFIDNLNMKQYWLNYCVIDKSNVYWYDNELYFKDVMGGLKLVYIMNYVYMLKSLIGKIVWYDYYLLDNNLIATKNVIEIIEDFRGLLKDFNKFWELINKEEINNGQNYSFEIDFIIDEISYGNGNGMIWNKLHLVVNNNFIKSINNKKGNAIMFDEFKKLREKMMRVVYKENEFIENGFKKEIEKIGQTLFKHTGLYREYPHNVETAVELFCMDKVKEMKYAEYNNYKSVEIYRRYESMIVQVFLLVTNKAKLRRNKILFRGSETKGVFVELKDFNYFMEENGKDLEIEGMLRKTKDLD